MGNNYKWERRDAKINKRGMHKVHGRRFLENVSNSQENAAKKRNLIKQLNVFIKQNALETASGMNLPSMKPQQLASMSNKPTSQANKFIENQKTINRSNAQPNKEKREEGGIDTRNFSFSTSGAFSYDKSLNPRIKEFNTLPLPDKNNYIDKLNPDDANDYSMLKFISSKGELDLQSKAFKKLRDDDVEQFTTPNDDNIGKVTVLASRTNNKANWDLLASNNNEDVRLSLVKNKNVPESFFKKMYSDSSYSVRYAIVDKANDQTLLHLFIADKNPHIRMKLIPKLDEDGLKILAKDKNTQVAAFARKKLSSSPRVEKQIDDNLTVATQESLPEYGYGTPVGAVGSTGNTPSMSRKSLILNINEFVTKAEIEKERLIAQRGKKITRLAKEFGTVSSGGFVPTYNGGGGKPKSNKEVERILGIVKSVGKEFFGE